MWCPLLIARNGAAYLAKTWRAAAREQYVCFAIEKPPLQSSGKRFISSHAPPSVNCLLVPAPTPVLMNSPAQIHRHSRPIV
jgi:hypothetical protein